jgi:hypothetical protein
MLARNIVSTVLSGVTPEMGRAAPGWAIGSNQIEDSIHSLILDLGNAPARSAAR